MSSGVYLVRVGTVLSAVGNGASGSVLLLFLASSMPAQLVAVPILFLSVGLSFGYLFCGPLVDSRHPLVVLVVGDVLRFVATAAIPFFLVTDHLLVVPLAVSCLVNGAMAAVSQTTLSALWADLAPAGRLRETLATNALLNRTGLAVGGGVGGILAGTGLFAFAIWLDAATFLLSAALWLVLLVTKSVGFVQPVERPTTKANPFSEVLASARLLRQTPWLFRYFLFTAIASIPGQIASTTAGPSALASMSPTQLAIWAAAPSWVLLAGNLLARLAHRIPLPGLVLVTSQSLIPIGQTLTVASSTAWGAIAFSSLGRFLEAVSQPSLNAYIGVNFPTGQRARVYAMTKGANSILAPLGLVATYWLLGGFSTTSVLMISGTTCATLVLLSLLTPGITKLEVQKVDNSIPE